MTKLTALLFAVLVTTLVRASTPPDKIIDIFAANKLLAKTINVGFTFDAPKEGEWGNSINEKEIENISTAGFTAIRLPIQWITRMDSVAPYAISPLFLSRIDQVIKQTMKNNLSIVIENCLDEQLMALPEKYKDRLTALWKQLSVHYASCPQQVMFEIMAEPHGNLDKVWEQYFSAALSIIREHNAVRPVIIGGSFFNSPNTLGALHLPENDKYIIATFHLYQPIKFTMQGELWFPFGKPMEWLGTKWLGTAAEQTEITNAMNIAASWATTHNRPVFMGEFGASDHADIDSRARFFKFYRQQAEQRNFSWGVFSYNVNFSVYDNSKNQWRAQLLQALMDKGDTLATLVAPARPNENVTAATAEDILNQSVTAQGGAAAIAAIKDITLGGHANINGQQIEVEEKYLFPSNYLQIMKAGDKVMRKTMVKDTAFLMTFQGSNLLVDEGVKESLKEKAAYFTELYLLKNKAYTYTFKGTETADGSDAYVLEIKTPQGRTITNYYDVKSGLKIKSAAEQQTPQGKYVVTNLYKDYQLFNGVQLPTTLVISLGSFDIEMKYNTVKINTGLSANTIQ